MTLLFAHVSLFAVAVAVAFALALIAVFALAFALALTVVFAAAFAASFPVAFALALASAYVIHVHRNCLSEVIHDPRLVRVQVGLDDRSQLVVVTHKLLRVHQQMVCGHSRNTTMIFTSSFSFVEERFS